MSILFNYFSFYGINALYFKFSVIYVALDFLVCVAVGRQSRCAVDCGWLSISPVKWHTDLCAAASGHVHIVPIVSILCPHRVHIVSALSSLTQVRDISIVAFITAITTGYCCSGWPLRGGHQDPDYCISCHASINKCIMYYLDTLCVNW